MNKSRTIRLFKEVLQEERDLISQREQVAKKLKEVRMTKKGYENVIVNEG